MYFIHGGLPSCAPVNKTPVINKAKPTSKKSLTYRHTILNNYQVFLTKLDTTQITSSKTAAKKHIEWFAGEDETTRDTAYLIFDAFALKLNNAIGDLHFKQNMAFDSLVIAIPITDTASKPRLSEKLAAYAAKLKENGFYVYMSEGDTYIGRDYDFVAKWFYPYVSPVLKQYLVQLNTEEKEGFQEDAGLTISPKQLATRTLWWEIFSAKHPTAIISATARANWLDYLSTLLYGMDDTPVIDNEQGTLSEYYNEAYTYIQDTSPASQTNKLINPYFKLLLKKNRAGADSMLAAYRKNILLN